MNRNIVWDQGLVTSADRQKLNGHASFVLWFTGLSGSGKSTIANALEYVLFQMGLHVYRLDGDNVRHGLNADLGFSERDRDENIRRVAEVAKILVDAGTIVLATFISPSRKSREQARALFDHDQFIEVYVDCPLTTCIERDPKGMYKKALEGQIKEFTGVTAPYEPPIHPDIVVKTDTRSLDTCVLDVIEALAVRHLVEG